MIKTEIDLNLLDDQEIYAFGAEDNDIVKKDFRGYFLPQLSESAYLDNTYSDSCAFVVSSKGFYEVRGSQESVNNFMGTLKSKLDSNGSFIHLSGDFNEQAIHCQQGLVCHINPNAIGYISADHRDEYVEIETPFISARGCSTQSQLRFYPPFTIPKDHSTMLTEQPSFFQRIMGLKTETLSEHYRRKAKEKFAQELASQISGFEGLHGFANLMYSHKDRFYLNRLHPTSIEFSVNYRNTGIGSCIVYKSSQEAQVAWDNSPLPKTA